LLFRIDAAIAIGGREPIAIPGRHPKNEPVRVEWKGADAILSELLNAGPHILIGRQVVARAMPRSGATEKAISIVRFGEPLAIEAVWAPSIPRCLNEEQTREHFVSNWER
jgi:hypothetical protein